VDEAASKALEDYKPEKRIQKTQEKIENDIKDTLNNIDPGLKPYQCEAEEHDDYIRYGSCHKEFHPTCIGISDTTKELETISPNFQCHKCNPDREYFKELNITTPKNRRKRLWSEANREFLKNVATDFKNEAISRGKKNNLKKSVITSNLVKLK